MFGGKRQINSIPGIFVIAFVQQYGFLERKFILGE